MTLAEAYARRVQWQAKLQATQIVRALAEAMGEHEPAAAGPQRRVSADQLLAQMGTGF